MIKTRRDVEEKSEQLRSVANLSALIAGFAVVSLIELNFDEDATSEVLVALYGTLTAITVALMVNAMVTCNLILAAILKNGKPCVCLFLVGSGAAFVVLMKCSPFSSTSYR